MTHPEYLFLLTQAHAIWTHGEKARAEGRPWRGSKHFTPIGEGFEARVSLEGEGKPEKIRLYVRCLPPLMPNDSAEFAGLFFKGSTFEIEGVEDIHKTYPVVVYASSEIPSSVMKT